MNLRIFQLSNLLRTNATLPTPLLFHVFSILSKKLINYPDHKNWYDKKVIPGLYEGSREILCATTGNNQIAGIVILKKETSEKKICSLYVSEQFRHKGIGRSLFIKSFDILETSSPLFSVSDLCFSEFKKLFIYFGFKDTFLLKNKYKIGSNEIVFNGILERDSLEMKNMSVICNIGNVEPWKQRVQEAHKISATEMLFPNLSKSFFPKFISWLPPNIYP